MTTATTTRADRISTLRDERDEIAADIPGWKTEIEDLLEEIESRKAEILALKARIAGGRARKGQIKVEIAELKNK